MSSELENVKNQVQQAASSIDEAATATQTAYSNAESKKERLNALGVHASYQALDQACENLQQAMGAIGTAHSEATKAATEIQSVADTMPIPESLPKLGSAVSELNASKTTIDGAAELVGNAKTDADQVGVQGIVAVCQAALDVIDAARSALDTTANAVNEYQNRLQQEAQDLDDLSSQGTATRSHEPSAPAEKPVIDRFVEQQRPINAKYAGKQFPLPDDLAAKYPGGVKFDDYGFPDFSPHAKHVVKIRMRGNRKYGEDGDFGDANEKAGYRRSAIHKGYTWHHLHDRTTMLLVPRALHEAVRHTGGVAVINKFGVLEDNDG